jgi:hypothetical protein
MYVCHFICFLKYSTYSHFHEISVRTHGPQAEMEYGTPGELQTENNEILLAARIFITIYIQLNIRTPDQKYLANQVDWWIRWISNLWCSAMVLTFDYKAQYISYCCHTICPK